MKTLEDKLERGGEKKPFTNGSTLTKKQADEARTQAKAVAAAIVTIVLAIILVISGLVVPALDRTCPDGYKYFAREHCFCARNATIVPVAHPHNGYLVGQAMHVAALTSLGVSISIVVLYGVCDKKQ